MPGRPLLKDAWRYVVAVASVLSALALTHTLGPHVVGTEPLFYGAVMISAFVGGLGPGLVATALAAACTAYFFLDPPNSLLIEGDDVVRFFIFIAVAVLISSLHARSRRSEQQLRRAEQAAVAANRAKDRFLAAVSHELRNPLFPVLTLSSMHEGDTSLPLQVREDMALIRRSAEMEARLIDDLLDLSRITAGKLSLVRENVDMVRVIEDAVAICAPAAGEKDVTVAVQVAQSQRTTVNGDPTRLRQVVWNLLSNAVKFTPAGGGVTVTLRDCADDAGALELRVRDTGVGIAPELLPRVFEAFEQGGADVTRTFGGLGLGLAIAKALVQAHGGNIEARSDGADRGSTFTVRLPSAPPTPAAADKPAPPTPAVANVFSAA